ncbi:hypothetical protein DKX38_017767 [Salix brachista]|uniref:Uncharacterized protein n=1 Tax=Salix brachista TaxID=2182728 RepID=A0A5N5KX23_9ROSI|nr:hypothetical protein DKX38_017767 [Salix brachista]
MLRLLLQSWEATACTWKGSYKQYQYHHQNHDHHDISTAAQDPGAVGTLYLAPWNAQPYPHLTPEQSFAMLTAKFLIALSNAGSANQIVMPQDQHAMILASLVVTGLSSISMERAMNTSA